MTTDATRPRQRFSGVGWSLDVHEDGDLEVSPCAASSTSRFRAKLAEPAAGRARAPRRIVLDMADVEYCDSSCLQILLRLGTRLREAGGQLAVVTTVHAVVRPIELLGLGDVMPVHPSVAATRAAWGGRA